MTSESPSEAPHYNGKTLSPASPKPIHIPDSQNIPVLQNQNDPFFNLMSTHVDSSSGPQTMHEIPADPNDLPVAPESTRDSRDMLANGAHTIQSNEATRSSGKSPERLDDGPALPQSPGSQSTESQQRDDHTSYQSHDNQSLNAETQSRPSHVTQSDFTAAPASFISQEKLNALTSDGHQQVSSKSSQEGLTIETGNIQALLDNLIATASSNAPPADPHAISSGVVPAPSASSPSSTQTPISSLPTPAGLPPRPPPQDDPAVHLGYIPGQNLRNYHKASSSASAQSPNIPNITSLQTSQSLSAANSLAPNGMPPPPGARFENQAEPTISSAIEVPPQQQDDVKQRGSPLAVTREGRSNQPAAGNDHVYQEFLRDEASYVAEGTWDRFPAGSRLFVGNLFTEKVSKRDIFDVFSPYGRLAQISMKNAYGFVQFIDPGSSSRAMLTEEGTELGGRKIHLEISKPQKNTRNSNNAGDRIRGGHARRSRSPDYNKGSHTHAGMQRQSSNAYGPYDRRGRDDYRPVRSPSPRGSRGYDGRGTDRYYGGGRSRSRSPYGRNVRYRSRSPRAREIDDEASLPIPRRNPVQIPEVQIIIVDESDRTFVGYIQQSFRERGLRCEVLQLPRGVSLQAVVKRQIIEGVQAVVKIYRKSQVTGKIPLQIFDRSGGMNNVRFDEYEELDAGVAADVVIRAKQTTTTHQSPGAPQFGQNYSHASGLNVQHSPQQQLPQPVHQQLASTANPSVQNAIQSLDSQTLQKLLSSLHQGAGNSSQYQGSPQQGQPPQDLAALLSNVARQTPQAQQGGYPQPPTPTQSYPPPYQTQQQPPPQQHQQYPQQSQQATANPFTSNPALAQLLSRAQPNGQQAGNQYQGVPHQQQQQQPQAQQSQNVQDIMAQLAKYRQ